MKKEPFDSDSIRNLLRNLDSIYGGPSDSTPASKKFEVLIDIIAALRSENGCPWDREQTHETLKPTLIEESYEVVEAIDAKVPAKLKEELGDLLLNVMLQAQIAYESEHFNVYDVIEAITEKLIRRHPHVFGNTEVDDAETVIKNWEEIKRQERGYEDRRSVLDGVPDAMPALYKAQKLQRRAAGVGFDWDELTDVISKVDEEIREVKASLKTDEPGEVEMELGDLLFAVVNLCRFVDVQAEEALRKANRKFTTRFKWMESELESGGKSFKDYNLEELEKIWQAAKKSEDDERS